MAILNGVIARRALAEAINPYLTVAHDQFAWVPMPFVTEGHVFVKGQALTTHWPVSSMELEIPGTARGAFLNDYYHRIHISPQRLDLGNVVSIQTTPVRLWNAHLEPRTLASIEGTDEGILVAGQPSPPMVFPALKELTWDVSVTPEGQPVLDTIVEWIFDNAESPGVRITANRIIAWSFVPDWADGVIERLTWATDILSSESMVELRRKLRLAPRRELEAAMYVEGRERQLLDLMLFGWGARIWALPLWHEIQILSTPVPAGALSVTCSTQYLDFRAGGLAMLRGESAFNSETVEIDAVTAGSLLLKRATQQAWPAGSRIYPVRPARMTQAPVLQRLTDQAIAADVTFMITDPCDWPAVMPATLYRGRPVLEARPDESEDLTSTYERLLLTLDGGYSTPLTTDTANRAMPVQSHRWIDMGRAARAAYRSMLYALAGRQVPLWVPTHADDLQLVATTSALSTVLDVAYVGYTRFGQSKTGRRDIRIELFNGTALHRRITGSIELDQHTERLAIDSALGVLVEPGDVMRISWLALCRGNSDAVEIHHQTDSEGVASSSLTFRGVRDDEF